MSGWPSWWCQPSNCRRGAGPLLLLDFLLALALARQGPHLNIDWTSYKEQAALLANTSDYSLVTSANGPLIYSAGYTWLYRLLHLLTDQGSDTAAAQLLAVGLYTANLALVLRILVRTETLPPWVLLLLSLGAAKVKAITVLHLFNDPVAMLCLHAALNMFLDNRWSLGSLFFSLGVSVKTNLLLFSPGLLSLYIT